MNPDTASDVRKTPILQPERVRHTVRISLRVPFLLFLALICGIPCVALAYPGDRDHIVLAGAVFLICIIASALVLERLVLTPLHALSEWLAAFRESEYQRLPLALPISGNEIGDLTREVTILSAQFNQSAKRIESANRQKQEILSIISHQLRTPVTGLEWGLEALLSPETPPDQRAQLANDLHTGLRRMVSVIKNMIDSASIDEGHYAYVFDKTDLVATLAETIEEQHMFAAGKRIAVTFNHAESELIAAIDKERFQHALSNLLVNALAYTPQNGAVTISLSKQGANAHIEITDTGVGMTEEELRNLYAKFYRGQRAVHMNPDGSGLGLYVARNVLDGHDATIAIRSREGFGTVVSIDLPLVHASKHAVIV